MRHLKETERNIAHYENVVATCDHAKDVAAHVQFVTERLHRIAAMHPDHYGTLSLINELLEAEDQITHDLVGVDELELAHARDNKNPYLIGASILYEPGRLEVMVTGPTDDEFLDALFEREG